MKKKLLIPVIGLSLLMVGCNNNNKLKSNIETETEINGVYADVEVIKYHDKNTNKNYIIFQSFKGLQVMEVK